MICVMLGAVLIHAGEAVADRRVALVIGNSAYPAAPLKNPLNDARTIAKSLNQLGFEVLLKTNLSQRAMIEAIRDFSARLKEGDVALFYYSGHGMQVKGRNFLIPVDADIRAEDEVPYLSFDVSQVLDKLEAARTRVNVVILDACRNNPFMRTFRSARVGLAQMDAPGGTLIAFSTAPGSEARDGDGELGTYTRYLVEQMATPGLPIEIAFRRVREKVTAETKDRQVPWESSSLKGDFYFNPAAEKSVVAAPAPAPVAAQTVDPVRIELEFWDSIKASVNRADFEAYLEQYPNGRFTALARNRVKSADQSAQLAAAQAQAAAKAETDARIAAERKARLDAEARLEAERRTQPAVVASAQPVPATKSEIIALAVPSSRLPGAPASARAAKIGDTWTYQLSELRFNKKLATITHVIAGGDSSGIQETLRINSALQQNAQRNSFTAEGNKDADQIIVQRKLSLEPYIFEQTLTAGVTLFEFFPFLPQFVELRPNTSWPAIAGAISDETNMEWEFSGKAAARERIRVPAGEFDTIRVELQGERPRPTSFAGPSSNVTRSTYQDYTVWFSPQVGRLVKYTRKMFNPSHTEIETEQYELVSYSLK